MTKEELIEALDRIPMLEKWIKAIKAEVKEMLEDNEDSLNGIYKLRGSGSTTAYQDGSVATLQESGQLSPEEFQQVVKINEPKLAKLWGEKFGVTAREAKNQIRRCLADHVVTKPKSPSIYKAKK